VKGYELLELLSSGHACDTYDAWSHERACRVIVRTGDVRREGRLLQRLTHPNIVRAYEVHRDWIVLETLGGATLAALLEDGPLDRDDALEMGRQLCSAVGYLHRRGWLHLDLKPSNLIADGGRLKVIDLVPRS
jgi:eukaryotic-like serine/threonine-protein kinase